MNPICSKCGETDITQFWKRTKSKTGYETWCKSCNRESARKSNKTNEDLLKGAIRNTVVLENKILKKENKRICCKCKEIFTMNKGTEIRCKACEKEKGKKDRAKHQEREKARRKAYYEANKEEIKRKRREKYKESKWKKKTDV